MLNSQKHSKHPDTKNFSLLHAGVEFTSGIISGCLIGYAIDHFFLTKPWGILIGFFLGIAAGALNLSKLLDKEKKL